MNTRRVVHRVADRVRIGAHQARSLPAGRTPAAAGTLDCVVVNSGGAAFCVPRAALHRPAAVALRRDRVYEPETQELLRSQGAGDVVHAGTFFGDFLPRLSRSRRDGALVWAFEPHPDSFRCAQITVLLNGLENVRLTHAALDSVDDGTGVLVTSGRAGRPLGGSSYLSSSPADTAAAGSDDATRQVPLTTVDATVPADRHVAVLQLDVEGHEQDALTGALGTIRRCRPLIVLESEPTPQWHDSHLAPLGYRRAGRLDHNTLLRCDEGPRP